MCGFFLMCGGVYVWDFVMCVLVFTVFCTFCTCFVYVYSFSFILSVPVPLSDNLIALNNNNNNNNTVPNKQSREHPTCSAVSPLCLRSMLITIFSKFSPLRHFTRGLREDQVFSNEWKYPQAEYNYITRRFIVSGTLSNIITMTKSINQPSFRDFRSNQTSPVLCLYLNTSLTSSATSVGVAQPKQTSLTLKTDEYLHQNNGGLILEFM